MIMCDCVMLININRIVIVLFVTSVCTMDYLHVKCKAVEDNVMRLLLFDLSSISMGT